MASSQRDSFQLSAVIGDQLIERRAPAAAELLAMLRRGEIWREASIYPIGADAPRASLSFHEGHGFVVQCHESENAWSGFLVQTRDMSPPQVELELGGQALERWPPELFVPELLATEALTWFLDTGALKPDLHWVRIERFPRVLVWEGREGRQAWERQHPPREPNDA